MIKPRLESVSVIEILIIINSSLVSLMMKPSVEYDSHVLNDDAVMHETKEIH